MNYKNETMNKPTTKWEPQKHPFYLMKLEAGDVIENLFLGLFTPSYAPQEDEVVTVTIMEDTEKTVFALQLDRPHMSSKAYWDAFVVALETVPLPEIRPEGLLED